MRDRRSINPRVGVVQDGARLHYGVPLALRRAGLLDRVLTDWYAAPGSIVRFLARAVGLVKPGVGRRMAERYAPGLDGVAMHSAPMRALAARLGRRRFASAEAYYEWLADGFADWALGGGRLDQLDVLVGFIRNLHPRLIEGAAARGIRVVGDQIIAPAQVEAAEAAAEATRWPGWEAPSAGHDYQLVARLEQRSWEALAHITCGSEYVRANLMGRGVTAEKITVVPYPDAPTPEPPRRPARPGPVVVGFVGAVSLRKGAPYFFAVAKRFDPRKVRFVMVGPIHLDRAVAAREQGPVELVGPVPRSAIRDWMARFDLFLFPSTCEGSAGAVIEALGAGLPVVTSPSSGTTVRDGRDGFIEDAREVDRLTARVQELAADENLRVQMSESAFARHREHLPECYENRLTRVIAPLIENKRLQIS